MKNQLNRSGLVLLLMALVLMLTEASVFAQRPDRDGEGREGRGQRPRGGEQGEQGQRGQRGQGGRQGQTSPLMRLFDTDGDGVVSTAEINSAGAVLLKMDKDGDGKLSAEELRPQGGRGGRGQRGEGGGKGPRGEGGGKAKGGGEGGGRGPRGGEGGGGDKGPRGGKGKRPPSDDQEGEVEDLSRRGGPRGDTQFASQLMELDVDGDGTLVRSELPEHMQVAFDKVDVNADGIASADERLALASKFRRNQLNPNGDTVKNAPTRGL